MAFIHGTGHFSKLSPLQRVECGRCISPQRRSEVHAATPLPSDTAPDMLSFALEGPGIIALGGILLSGIGVVVSNFRPGYLLNKPQVPEVEYVLKIESETSLRFVEPGSGIARAVPAGSTELRYTTVLALRSTVDALEAVADSEGVELQAWVWRTGKIGLRPILPRAYNAHGGRWEQRAVQPGTEDADRIRFEYDAMGPTDDIDEEWARLMDKYKF